MTMEILTTSGDSLGLESLGRNVLLRLAASVNAEINAVTSVWAASDLDFATKMGLTYSPLVLEEVDLANMHLGHVPALIDAPISKYPNISVLASDEDQSPSGGWDQGNEFNVNFYIEMMAKDENTQEDVNKRIQRMSSAVHSVVMADQTLGGDYSFLQLTSFGVSDVFVRRQEKSRGPSWYWQGSRLDYQVRVPVGY